MVNIQEYLHIILILLVIIVAAVLYMVWRQKKVTANNTDVQSVQTSYTPVEEIRLGGRRRRKHKK